MSRSFFVSAFLLLIAIGHVCAQTTIKDALPPGPLIVTQLPKYAQWSIDFSYASADKPGQPPAAGAGSRDSIRLAHDLVTKADDVVHEERIYEDGSKSELWSNNDIAVEREPKTAVLTAAISAKVAEHAFPDFDWISRQNFIGIKSHDGVNCMAFEAPQYNFEHDFIGTADAWINIATRYPVGYQLNEQTRSYKIMDAPETPLEIPAEFLAASRQMQEHIQQATPHLAPP